MSTSSPTSPTPHVIDPSRFYHFRVPDDPSDEGRREVLSRSAEPSLAELHRTWTTSSVSSADRA